MASKRPRKAPAFKKTTKRKWGGDDAYSWAVFSKKTGIILAAGCSKSEAEYYQRCYEKEQ